MEENVSGGETNGSFQKISRMTNMTKRKAEMRKKIQTTIHVVSTMTTKTTKDTMNLGGLDVMTTETNGR